MIAKRVYVGKYADSCSVCQQLERLTDIVNDCLKKYLDVREGRRMMYDKSGWWEFVRGNGWCVP